MEFLLRLLGLVLLAAASMTGTLCVSRFNDWQQVDIALQEAQFTELLALFGFTLLLAMGGVMGLALAGALSHLEQLRLRLADPYEDHPKMAPGAYADLDYLPEV